MNNIYTTYKKPILIAIGIAISLFLFFSTIKGLEYLSLTNLVKIVKTEGLANTDDLASCKNISSEGCKNDLGNYIGVGTAAKLSYVDTDGSLQAALKEIAKQLASGNYLFIDGKFAKLIDKIDVAARKYRDNNATNFVDINKVLKENNIPQATNIYVSSGYAIATINGSTDPANILLTGNPWTITTGPGTSLSEEGLKETLPDSVYKMLGIMYPVNVYGDKGTYLGAITNSNADSINSDELEASSLLPHEGNNYSIVEELLNNKPYYLVTIYAPADRVEDVKKSATSWLETNRVKVSEVTIKYVIENPADVE